jgi:hypothetical protein
LGSNNRIFKNTTLHQVLPLHGSFKNYWCWAPLSEVLIQLIWGYHQGIRIVDALQVSPRYSQDPEPLMRGLEAHNLSVWSLDSQSGVMCLSADSATTFPHPQVDKPCVGLYPTWARLHKWQSLGYITIGLMAGSLLSYSWKIHITHPNRFKESICIFTRPSSPLPHTKKNTSE